MTVMVTSHKIPSFARWLWKFKVHECRGNPAQSRHDGENGGPCWLPCLSMCSPQRPVPVKGRMNEKNCTIYYRCFYVKRSILILCLLALIFYFLTFILCVTSSYKYSNSSNPFKCFFPAAKYLWSRGFSNELLTSLIIVPVLRIVSICILSD